MLKPSSQSRSSLFLVGVLVLSLGSKATPIRAATQPVGGWPAFAFAIGSGVNLFWLPRDAVFAYYGQGYYFRWQAGHWIHAPDPTGPWKSLTGGFILPKALDYGPPPPVRPDRAYFTWWRQHAAPWWRLHHPRWWHIYQADLSRYRLWRERAIPVFLTHTRFWEMSGGRTLHRDFVPAHPSVQASLPEQRIRTLHLTRRYYQGEANQFQWTHPWSAYRRFGNEGSYMGPWNPYPFSGSTIRVEGWYGNPWDPWGYAESPWFQTFYGDTWEGGQFPGDNQPFSPWIGNPVFAPWNGYPYNNP
ncbi:MAG: hypothetical protein ACYCS1_05585 [Gammaproteobacteria bacterium]